MKFTICAAARLRRLSSFLACAILSMLLATVASAREEKLAVVANGTVIGTAAVTIEGRTATIDYSVSNNGRGPSHRALVEFGDDGIPLSWRVEGNSVMGAPVTEEFSWKGGHARWSSEPDKGDIKATRPQLYILSEGNPWTLGVYARALLKAPGNRLDILPGGAMTLVKAREASIGGVPITIYRLHGFQLQPDYVALDADGMLFASLQQSAGGMPPLLAIRSTNLAEAASLRTLLTEIEDERAQELQRRLAHDFKTPVRIVNARIFDPDSGAVGKPTTVVIHGGRITRTEAQAGDESVADGAAVIDAEGGVLMPGLSDMHVHTSLNSGPLLIAAGITTIRDMGNDNGFLERLVTRIDSGEILGPRIVRSGFIEGKSPFSANNGKVAETLPEAIDAVRWYGDRGYRQIKLYNSIRPEWMAPLATEAHRLGMGVTGHIPAFARPNDAVVAGFDELTHINQLILGWVIKEGEDSRTPLRLLAMARAADLDLSSEPVQRTIDLIVQKGTRIDPTVSIFEWLMLSRAGAMPPTDTAFYDHMPMGFQRAEKRTYVKLDTPDADARFRAGFEKMLETIRLLYRKGVPVLPGTDMGNGFNLHRELILYVRAGLTPAEALKAATLDVARYLGRDQQTGSIARDKVADLVLVSRDPTREITAITAPRMVIKAGTIYYPSEIYEELGIMPFAPPPRRIRRATAN